MFSLPRCPKTHAWACMCFIKSPVAGPPVLAGEDCALEALSIN